MAKSLILLRRRLAKELAKKRKCIGEVFDFVRRRLAKVGEAENPHTPYALARGCASRRAYGLGQRRDAAR